MVVTRSVGSKRLFASGAGRAESTLTQRTLLLFSRCKRLSRQIKEVRVASDRADALGILSVIPRIAECCPHVISKHSEESSRFCAALTV
jgi:hypothetical protein